MKNIEAVLAIAGFSAALAFAGPAAAQSDSSFYVGGTVGQSNLKSTCSGVDGCDNTDTAWRILGGYNCKLEGPTGDETTNDVTYGAGVRYDFTKHIGVRGEWQRYQNMGGNNVVKTDVDVVSIGVVYRFQ